MRTFRALSVSGLSALALLSITTTGCGGSSSAASSGSGGAATHSSSQHSTTAASGSADSGSAAPAGGVHTDLTKKPCDLVTLADAEKALGLTLTTSQSNVEISGINVNCVYRDSNGHRVQVVVSEQPQTADQLTQFSSHAATEVPGVGDRAYWNAGMATLFVSDHSVGYSVGVFDDHLTLGDAKVAAAAAALGKVAASRLG